MKTVQDRLLTQMVSGRDKCDISAFGLFFSVWTQPSMSSDLLEWMWVTPLSMLYLPAARGWDPDGEERSACSVFPLSHMFSSGGTHSASKEFFFDCISAHCAGFHSESLPEGLVFAGPAFNPQQCAVCSDLDNLCFSVFLEKLFLKSVGCVFYSFLTSMTCFFIVSKVHNMQILWSENSCIVGFNVLKQHVQSFNVWTVFKPHPPRASHHPSLN